MKKLLFLFLFLSALPLFPQTNGGDELQQKDFGMLFTLFLDYDNCVGCDYLRFNGQIDLINKSFPDATFSVVYKTNDSSKYDKSIEKKLNAKNFIVLSDKEIFDKLEVKIFPTLVVFNFHGDEIARFDGMKFDNLQLKEIGKKSTAKKLNYNYVMLDTAENNKLGRPYVFSNFIQDSAYYALDVIKNTIMVYSANTGKLLNKIPPPELLTNYFAYNLTKDDIALLNTRKMPLARYNTIVPINSRSFFCKSSNISGIPRDTIIKINNNDTSIIYNKSIMSESIFSIFTNYEISTVQQSKAAGDGYYIRYPNKISENKFYSNISPYISKFNKDKADSVFLLAVADNVLFDGCKYLFPFSLLFDAYNMDTINVNSIGSFQYSEKLNKYIYFNSFAEKTFFCSFNPEKNEIEKYKPLGFLDNCSAKENRNLFKTLPQKSDFVDNRYIEQESLIINDKYITFILPQNEDGFTHYFIIVTYDVNGNFLNETYYYSDDKFYSANFFKNYTDNSGCLLLQSKKRRWHLVKLSDL